jgi:hypothetical protein
MRENVVEQYLVRLMKLIGGMCEKHTNDGFRGDPDRICVFPGGHIVLVETKWEEGVEPEDHQKRRHTTWRKHGVTVEVVRSREQAFDFVTSYLEKFTGQRLLLPR